MFAFLLGLIVGVFNLATPILDWLTGLFPPTG